MSIHPDTQTHTQEEFLKMKMIILVQIIGIFA